MDGKPLHPVKVLLDTLRARHDALIQTTERLASLEERWMTLGYVAGLKYAMDAINESSGAFSEYEASLRAQFSDELATWDRLLDRLAKDDPVAWAELLRRSEIPGATIMSKTRASATML